MAVDPSNQEIDIKVYVALQILTCSVLVPEIDLLHVRPGGATSVETIGHDDYR